MKAYDYEIRLSHYNHHVLKIIKEYQEPTRFYSVGGDGFVNQVIQALVYTAHELVVIPYGTGNDFSRGHHHSQDPQRILVESLGQSSQKIDTILMNDTYFINVACFGLDALVANTVHDVEVPKRFSYVFSLLRNVKAYQFPRLKIMVNDKLVYDNQITLCALANSCYYGGGFCISPDSMMNDGVFEIKILSKINKWKAPYYITKLFNKTLYQEKKTFTMKVRECVVLIEGAVNYDGEKGVADSYHFKICPSSINLVL